MKVPAGTTNVNDAPSVALWSPIAVATVGALFAAVTSMVMVLAAVLSSVPSLTLKPKVAYGTPLAFAAGLNVKLPSSMFAFVITWFTVTSTPPSSRSPAVSSVVIFTLESVSPVSAPANPKSAAVKVYAVSSFVVTVLSAPVGRWFTV